MTYEAALAFAWEQLKKLSKEKSHTLRFLSDEYSIDLSNQRVLSASCNVAAKSSLSILLLHYLVRKFEGLPKTEGEWISFKELAGGQGYYPAFKKRVVDVIRRKYQDRPKELLELTERLPVKVVQLADISIVLNVLDCLPILITFWYGDEEFGSEANVLFDKSIGSIFSTEDIVVLSEIIARTL